VTEPKAGKIHAALIAVLRDIGQDGIGKERKNQQQGYQFRGVDDVMNAFAPLLSKHGIGIIPSFGDRTCEERVTKNGGALFVVTVKGTFRLFAEDGSEEVIGPIYGEASDTADKATNKAMAVAFKYAMFQAFCVPIEGVTGGDADEQTNEVRGKAQVKQHPSAGRKPAPKGEPEVSPELAAAREALNAKRKEVRVSGADLLAFMKDHHKSADPQAWTVAQIKNAIAWLDLGAPAKAEKVPA
jgi:hypothetical protein